MCSAPAKNVEGGTINRINRERFALFLERQLQGTLKAKHAKLIAARLLTRIGPESSTDRRMEIIYLEILRNALSESALSLSVEELQIKLQEVRVFDEVLEDDVFPRCAGSEVPRSMAQPNQGPLELHSAIGSRWQATDRETDGAHAMWCACKRGRSGPRHRAVGFPLSQKWSAHGVLTFFVARVTGLIRERFH